MSIVRRRDGRMRRTWVPVAAASIAVAGVVAAGAAVAPSTFEGSDGNLLATVKDWSNVGLTSADGFADASGSTDDSFGGSKEGDANPLVVAQSVPPKNDFVYAALKTERVDGQNFLYQSSIRQSPNGSANLNIELNQGTATPKLSANGVTPNRVVNDRLITFDFTAGGTRASISLLKWVDQGACALSTAVPPCWGTAQALSLNSAEGAANDGQNGRSGDLTAAQNPLTGTALKANTFQEMAINLTAAGVFGNGCSTFAYVQLKSRSSGSEGTFNADLKDLILANKTVANCGSIRVRKTDDTGATLGGVKFDLYTNAAPTTAPMGVGDIAVSPAKSCTTAATTNATTGAVAGECVITGVPFGEYWVVEDSTTTPANHNGAAPQAVSVTGTTTTTLTFVNARQPGSVTITKQDDQSPPAPLGGVAFTLYADNTPVGGTRGSEDTATTNTCTTATVTTAAGVVPATTKGVCTISNVTLGRYWVVEGTPPSGYAGAAEQNVTLSTGGQNVGLTFTNARTHRVIVLVCHEGSDTLASATDNVTVGTTSTTSLASVPAALAAKGVTQADLCGLGGASYGGLGHDTTAVTPSVAVSTH